MTKLKSNERTARWLALTREPDTMDALCTAQAAGRGAVAWCREHDVRYMDAMRWIEEDSARAFAWSIATKARGAANVAQLESVTRMAIAGAVDPRAAAVASKNLQWLASVHDRKSYGEQMRVDHRHGLAEDHLAVLKGIVRADGLQHVADAPGAEARIAREGRPMIEGQFTSVPHRQVAEPVRQRAQVLDEADSLGV